MARYTIPGGIGRVIRDANGVVVPNATVVVYLGGTTNLAVFYTAISGGAPVTSVVSDVNGRVLIFVDDNDYPLTTPFKFVTTYGSITTTDDYVR